MIKFLKDLIARKKKELKVTEIRFEASKDEAEVRALGDTLEALKNEIADAEEQLKKLEDDNNGSDDGKDDDGQGARSSKDDDGDDDGQRGSVPAGATLRNAQVVGSYSMASNKAKEEEDPRDTKAYRKAFMNFVCRNTPIPAELREATKTTDAGAVIPTTILKEIIQKLDSYGNVYALVRKLNVQGGVAIPILSLKPEATWVGEGASDSKKLEAKTSITFSYFGVECKIAQTLLANVTTLDAFQQLFVPLATEAIVKAVEIAIFNGNGTTQPLGITKDTRVPEGNVIEITPEEFTTWDGWHKAVKAKMKKAYRNGVFFMNQATFDGYIDGMVDKNGQPVGRTNYGINGEETYRFMGKAVETVEDECIASYDDAEEGDVIAIFMKPTDYAINSNMQMTTVKWTDHDTNELKNKCILICDGKLVDANGVLIIKKGATLSA